MSEQKIEEVVEKEETEEVKEPEIDEKDARIEELSAKVEELEGKVNILKNEYARAYADTENMKKRLQNQFEQSNKYRIQSFALEILPVIDNCERALAVPTEDENYRKGVEMIYKQLTTALQREGVEEIQCLNEEFDPNWHQALMSEKREDTEPGKVIEVLQKGYKLKDRLLRAAMVKISE
ncbi:MAG: nucleotide exchange factor GrpE [Solobacterium sp.]|nr:nucleotide exchange factor GrpE [Solobacterium sp.]